MKQPQIIKVTIGTDGAAKVEAVGFTGSSCKDATRNLERNLGAVTADKPKAEMFEATTQVNAIQR